MLSHEWFLDTDKEVKRNVKNTCNENEMKEEVGQGEDTIAVGFNGSDKVWKSHTNLVDKSIIIRNTESSLFGFKLGQQFMMYQ